MMINTSRHAGTFASSGGRWVTRAEAACILGRHTSWVRRREGTELHPVVGRDGWHRFDETEVFAVAPRLRRLPDSSESAATFVDAETASRVFAAFEAGKTGVDVVIEEKIHPTVVLAIRDFWWSFGGQIVLSAALVAELNQLGWPGAPDDLRDGEEVVARVRAIVDCLQERRRTACGRCESRPARLCVACAKRLIERATERAVAP